MATKSNCSMPPIGPSGLRVGDVMDMMVSLDKKRLPIVKIMVSLQGAAMYARLALETYPDARVSIEQDDNHCYKVTIDKKK